MTVIYLKLYRSCIQNYQAIWNDRLDTLENYLKRMNGDEKKNKNS
jgi:uncharacterized protein (DUF39 family)